MMLLIKQLLLMCLPRNLCRQTHVWFFYSWTFVHFIPCSSGWAGRRVENFFLAPCCVTHPIFPPTHQGGINGSCYTLHATDNFSRHQCNNLGLSVFETEAQHELSMTPDHSIKEFAKRKSYIKENYQVGKQYRIIRSSTVLTEFKFIHIFFI